MASTATMPKVSSHCEGTTTARELARIRTPQGARRDHAIVTDGCPAAQRVTVSARSPPPTTTRRSGDRERLARKPSQARIRNGAPLTSSSRPTYAIWWLVAISA